MSTVLYFFVEEVHTKTYVGRAILKQQRHKRSSSRYTAIRYSEYVTVGEHLPSVLRFAMKCRSNPCLQLEKTSTAFSIAELLMWASDVSTEE